MEEDKERKFIPDKERFLDNENDLLKTHVYADTLKEAILKTPLDDSCVFTIGVFGSWGSGKSSIIKTVQNELDSDPKRKKIKFITYDAWKYANDSFRRMFLRTIQKELGCKKVKGTDRYYQSETMQPVSNEYKAILVLLLFIISFIGFASITPINCIIPNLAVLVNLMEILVIICGVIFLGRQISLPQLFAPEQFEEIFQEIIRMSRKKNYIDKCLKYFKFKKNGSADWDKLIIVIDNIDRCHNSMAYQLLTDIKCFQFEDDCSKNANFHIVFVIPVDDEALKRNLLGNLKNSNKEKEMEEFLRKIFNLTIKIKPHQSTELNIYAKRLNEKYKLGFREDTIALCSKEFAANPRRIIQIFNNLTAELFLYNNDKEFSKNNESVICAILILREEYTDFYNSIIRDSSKLLKYPYHKNEYEKNENLTAFMSIAAPLFRNIKTRDLFRIINNSEAVFDQISEDIKQSINSYIADTAIIYINESSDEKKEIIVDYIKKCTIENLNSDSDIQIINSLEFISKVFTNIEPSLSPIILSEIDAKFKDKYENLIKKIDENKLAELCRYANLLEKNKLKTLKGSIISLLADEELEKENKNFYKNLINAISSSFFAPEDED